MPLFLPRPIFLLRLMLPILTVAGFAGSARGQTGADHRTGELIETARSAYSPLPPRKRCGESEGGGDEIVVCAPDHGERWRVPPTSETDPGSRAALRDGLPRAPQLDRGSCRGQPGCVIGGWAPPPVYYIDIEAIPEAPEGSDADRVAKGELAER